MDIWGEIVRGTGDCSVTWSGVSDPREGSKILCFLFGSPLACSLLLLLRSSWTLYPRKFV
jgi:hypothetical protein